MVVLFANVRMIVISLIPNLLALMITAGIMGYFDIPLKASTALIFSITFGISVDNSIRFLAKYRQEILSNNFQIPLAVSDSILETGKSIIYTSIVLFAGFIIFAFSDFRGNYRAWRSDVNNTGDLNVYKPDLTAGIDTDVRQA